MVNPHSNEDRMFYVVQEGQLRGPYKGTLQDTEGTRWWIPALGIAGQINIQLFVSFERAADACRKYIDYHQMVLDAKSRELNNVIKHHEQNKTTTAVSV